MSGRPRAADDEAQVAEAHRAELDAALHGHAVDARHPGVELAAAQRRLYVPNNAQVARCEGCGAWLPLASPCEVCQALAHRWRAR